MEPNRREFQKQCAFQSFCKRVLHNEACNAHDEIRRRRKREVSFCDLALHEERQLYTVDKYKKTIANYINPYIGGVTLNQLTPAIVIGKNSDGTYKICDPVDAYSSWDATMSGNHITGIGGRVNCEIDQVIQYVK